MAAAGGQGDQYIALFRPPAGDDGLLFDHAHAKTGQVIIAALVQARHFGRLSADQAATGRGAARRDAPDNGFRRLHIQPGAGEIIQEKQRRRALREHVIHAHGHEVNAD